MLHYIGQVLLPLCFACEPQILALQTPAMQVMPRRS